MVINLIGECDKRPIAYTLLKIMQEFGDVLYLSNESRVLRLSDTRQSLGHYQNVMIAYTEDNYDDFFDTAKYAPTDFDNILVEGIDCAEADLVIFVEGMLISEFDDSTLEMIDEYKCIKPFKSKMYTTQTMRSIETFEAFRDMCPMPQNVVTEVINTIAHLNVAPVKTLQKVALRDRATSKQGLLYKK